jgi:thymidylate kinase
MQNGFQFYVIEGPDGCGKTSVAQALAKQMNAWTFNPSQSHTFVPEDIAREDYYKSMLRKFEPLIEEHLKTQNVVLPRSAYSIPPLVYAYDEVSVKVPSMRIIPDRIIYLQVPLDTLERRIFERQKDPHAYRYHEQNADAFSRLVAKYESIMPQVSGCHIIDGTQSVDAIVSQILSR